MMVFFFTNMMENQCLSTGAFEISLNGESRLCVCIDARKHNSHSFKAMMLCVCTDVPVWSKLESGHLPSMQQLLQILENEMKLNAHMDTLPLQRS